MTESADNSQKILKVKCPGCGQKLDVTSIPAFTKINCPVCNRELIVPRWFDNYLLENEIGTGCIAHVYKSMDLTLEREIAIKILDPAQMADISLGELFLHEAKKTATLNHYAVVPIYTCGKSENTPYIAMQYMPGGSLEKKMQDMGNRIPLTDVVNWMFEVAEGLKCAAENDVLHHDIKPANIIFDGEGNAKLCDFGIAQILASNAAVKYGDVSRLLFNPYYVSPEKITSGQENAPGDIYSLGAVFYHVVTGRPPFVHDNPAEMVRMRLSVMPSAPEKFRKDIDSGFSCLLLSMLSRNPEERPAYKNIISTLTRLKEALSNQGKSNITANNIPVRREVRRRLLKEQHRSRIILKTALGFLNTLIAFGIVGFVFFLWYQGYLEKWLPFNISVEHTEAPIVILDPNPEISWHLAHGNWQNAVMYSSIAMTDGQQKSSERVVAMFQYFCAGLLSSSKTTGVRNILAGKLNPAINSLDSAHLHDPDVEPLLSLTRYLVDMQAEEPDFDELNPMKQVSFFILAAYDRESEDKLLTRLNDVKSALEEMPKGHWLVKSFYPRLPRWRQVIADGNGVREETEPLLRRYLKEEGEWKEKSTADNVLDLPPRWKVQEKHSL